MRSWAPPGDRRRSRGVTAGRIPQGRHVAMVRDASAPRPRACRGDPRHGDRLRRADDSAIGRRRRQLRRDRNLQPGSRALLRSRRVAFQPGSGSATVFSLAEELGSETAKLLPAAASDGSAFVRGILGPSPWAKLIPTNTGHPKMPGRTGSSPAPPASAQVVRSSRKRLRQTLIRIASRGGSRVPRLGSGR